MGIKPDRHATRRHLKLSPYPRVVLKGRLLIIMHSCGPQIHIIAPESSAKDSVNTLDNVYQIANEQLAVGAVSRNEVFGLIYAVNQTQWCGSCPASRCS